MELFLAGWPDSAGGVLPAGYDHRVFYRVPGAPAETGAWGASQLGLNTRSPQVVALLGDITKARIRTWSSPDVLLWDFFFQVFWEQAVWAREAGLRNCSAEGLHRQKFVARKGVPPGELADWLSHGGLSSMKEPDQAGAGIQTWGLCLWSYACKGL